jgi:short-subunit dehydrogenase
VQVRVLAADLAHPDGLTSASEQISADAAITMLVNNAGTSNVEPVAQVSVETITNLIALNVTALTVLTKAVLPGFMKRNAGIIVNIGSAVSSLL